MKIERAIEILELDIKMEFEGCSDEIEAALRLGIEALKRLQDNRKDPEFDHWVLLPGETWEKAP